jgi:hypothetical protein
MLARKYVKPFMGSTQLFVWAALVLVLFSFPAGLTGQAGRSGITGTVADPSGAVVPNATITLKNEATNVEWSSISSATGVYVIRNLPPGSYTVTATASSFQRKVTEHVLADVDKVSTVDISLLVGAVTQEVTVTAAPSVQLNAESSTVGQLVTSKEIAALPLNGRSWVSLNYLTPGAVVFHGVTACESVMCGVTPLNVVVNGLRGGNNQYFIDGAYTQSRETQVILIIPPLDALGEFRVRTGNVAAEYESGGAGVISAATKSGTNKVHGSAYEFLRNNAVDARNFFSPGSLPAFQRNQFGAVAGGPIRKDRTFWFAGYEGFRQREGQTLVGDYPTAAERAGDLSDLLPGTQLTDPLTGAEYLNNQVPVSALSASWLATYIPLPNTNVPVGQRNLRIPEKNGRTPQPFLTARARITRTSLRWNPASC